MQTTNSGVLLLKKSKIFCARAFFLAEAILFFTLLFSCKSAPQVSNVESLDLIDPDSPMLIYIPVESNQEFLAYAFEQFAGINKDDASKVITRTQNVAVSASGGNGSYQIALKGSYPSIGIKSALSEKNGFTPGHSTATAVPYPVYDNARQKIQVTSPDNSILGISQNTESMLVRYEGQIKVLSENLEAANSHNISELVYNFLTDCPQNEIKFYSNNPAAFVSVFLGKVSNMGLTSLCGSLTNSKKANTFALRLELELANPATAKAVCAMLKLALFPVPAKIQQTAGSKIIITDISLTWNKLIKLMTR
jgi:hypothetical protein